MHSTGRGGCACSTLILIPCRTSLRNCCLVRHLAGYTLCIYWFGMRYRTESLRHGIARWIMIDSLPASLHSGFNPNFGAQPVCATWKDIEFECSLLPHARRWQQGSIKFEFNVFMILEPNRFKIQGSASPILKV